jgi:uncharacterized membrane protein
MAIQPGTPQARSPAAFLYEEEPTSLPITGDGARRAAEQTRDLFERSLSNGQLARGLGWFSIALGATQLLAPRQLSRAIGVEEHPVLMRTLGLREIASGIAILADPNTTGAGLRARVIGDAMDLALLGSALAQDDSERGRVSFATLAVLGVSALDLVAAREYDSEADSTPVIIGVRKSIAINSSPDALYQMWRDFERLPRIMRHLQSVRLLDDGRSHWVAKAPAGMRVEWDAEVVADEAGKLLAWRSLPGSQVENMGTVRFESLPGRRGTRVTVDIEYRPPAGRLGAKIAKLFGEEPGAQLNEDLRRFKQLIETGEVATTRAQSAGRRTLKYRVLSTKEPAHAR